MAPMRKLYLLAVALLFVLVTSVLDSTHTAEALSVEKGQPLYLALGNSLAAGVGASKPVQTGYVNLVFEHLQDTAPYADTGITILNLGVPGETSTSLLATGAQLEKALQEIDSRRSDQIQGNEVQVITIDIGGNDLLALTQGGTPCRTDPSGAVCQQIVASTLTDFSTNFARTLTDLRRSAGPDALILALTLYNSYSGTGGDLDAPGDLVVQQLNTTVQSVASRADVDARVADIFPAFQGKAPSLTHIGETPPDIHPNDDGYRLMADAVIAVLASPVAPATATVAPATAPVDLGGGGLLGSDDSPALYLGLLSAGAIVALSAVFLVWRRRSS